MIRNEGQIKMEEEETQRQSLAFPIPNPLSLSLSLKPFSLSHANTHKMALFRWIYTHTK